MGCAIGGVHWSVCLSVLGGFFSQKLWTDFDASLMLFLVNVNSDARHNRCFDYGDELDHSLDRGIFERIFFIIGFIRNVGGVIPGCRSAVSECSC